MIKLGNLYVMLKGQKYQFKDVFGYNFNADAIIHFDTTDSFQIKYSKGNSEKLRIRLISPKGMYVTTDPEKEPMLVDDFTRRYNLIAEVDILSLLNYEIKNKSDSDFKDLTDKTGGYDIQCVKLPDVNLFVILSGDLIIHMFLIPSINTDDYSNSYEELLYAQMLNKSFQNHIVCDTKGNLYIKFRNETVQFNLKSKYDLVSVDVGLNHQNTPKEC